MAGFWRTPAGLHFASAQLPDEGELASFGGATGWLNSEPLTPAGLRGKVVLVDFWTYTCINWLRQLPYVRAWAGKYAGHGLVVIGVHTPEFSFEHDASNVQRAIGQEHIHYPVAQDNAYATWNAWGNEYWPAEYLIDAHGDVRHTQFGEGDYKKSEAAVRALLADAGAKRLPPPITAKPIVPSAQLATPETYLGSERADPSRLRLDKGIHAYPADPGSLPLSSFALTGTWNDTPEAATAVAGAGLQADFQAADVYLVLSSPGNEPRKVQVSLDGKPDGSVTVTHQQLYQLVHLPDAARHQLQLKFAPGLSAFAFTFG
jgi:thiol-disulfide isomerase/thioredoxin